MMCLLAVQLKCNIQVLVDGSDDGVAQEQNGGIMLTIGYLPGMKVKLITLIADEEV